jgi:hypothetical protein
MPGNLHLSLFSLDVKTALGIPEECTPHVGFTYTRPMQSADGTPETWILFPEEREEMPLAIYNGVSRLLGPYGMRLALSDLHPYPYLQGYKGRVLRASDPEPIPELAVTPMQPRYRWSTHLQIYPDVSPLQLATAGLEVACALAATHPAMMTDVRIDVSGNPISTAQ